MTLAGFTYILNPCSSQCILVYLNDPLLHHCFSFAMQEACSFSPNVRLREGSKDVHAHCGHWFKAAMETSLLPRKRNPEAPV